MNDFIFGSCNSCCITEKGDLIRRSHDVVYDNVINVGSITAKTP